MSPRHRLTIKRLIAKIIPGPDDGAIDFQLDLFGSGCACCNHLDRRQHHSLLESLGYQFKIGRSVRIAFHEGFT